MAFTDPIVAGDELVRAAINSSNYVQGQSGWRVARDGSAEFNDLTVRNSINVNSIVLGGNDLIDTLEAFPRGCVAWMIGSPTTLTNTQDGIMYIEADMVAGRMYEISTINITPDITNPNACEYHLRWTQGTGAWPNNGSILLSMSLRLSQFQLGLIRTYFKAPATDRFRFRTSIVSLDGANVRNWSPGAGCIMVINDLGPVGNAAGSSGNVPPGKTLKEWTWSSGLAARYKGDGTLAGGPPNLPSETLSQGDFADGQGNYRSWCVFGAAARADFDDLIGVPAADIITAEIYFNYDWWWNGSGFATLGYHNQIALGINEPGGGVANKITYFYPGTGGQWVDLIPYGFAVGTFLESLQSGYFEGFMIGNAGGSNKDYTGWAMHTLAVRPAIHLKYLK